MAVDVAGRLQRLIEADIAGLMNGAIRDIRQRLEQGDPEFASRILVKWESVLGDDLSRAARGIAATRGFDGFRLAAHQFANTQGFRRRGIEWLHFGIARSDSRLVQHWSWIAHGYMAAVAAFASDRQAMSIANALSVRTDSISKSRLFQPFLALRTNLVSRRLRLRDAADGEARRRRRICSRILDLASLAEESANKRRPLLRERDAWRKKAVASSSGGADLGWVTRLPSPALQVREYASVVHAAESLRAAHEIKIMCDAVGAQLREIQALCKPGPSPAAPPELEANQG